MSSNGLPVALLSKVTPLTLKQYAHSTGWSKIGEVHNLAVYRVAGVLPVEASIPEHPEFTDYARRVSEVVSAFAEHEERSAIEVLNDLLVPPADILRFGVTSPSAENGTLNLLDGLNLLNGARKSLLAAASDVLEPAPYHPRLARSEAEAFVKSCKLGQTERGSFVVALVCPIYIKPSEQEEIFPDLISENFTRRVTTRFMQSINLVVETISTGDLEKLASQTDFMVSANFLEGMLEMNLPEEPAALNVSCSWSRSIPVTTNVPRRARVTAEFVPAIEIAVAKLRPHLEPKKDTYVGKIVSLRGTADDEGHMQGEVTFSFLAEDELLRAKISLGPKNYVTACDAHKLDKYVSVSGVLLRGARIHTIQEHSGIEVLNISSAK